MAHTLSENHEFDHYVNAFTTSSDRVRRMMLINLVASVLVFAAYHNVLPNSWWHNRITGARIAVRNQIWKDLAKRLAKCYSEGREAAGFVDDCKAIEPLQGLITYQNHGEVSLKAHLEELERSRVSELLLVSVPFLGIRFDINDLGAISAFGLAALLFTLSFAMARQHENLFLALWRVRRLIERDEDWNRRTSTANFLYHALAMAQVFARPPTLARWQPSLLARGAARFLLVAPVTAQTLIVYDDLRTFGIASAMNSSWARWSKGLEIGFFGWILVFTFISWSYARSGDLRWRETFFAINPALLKKVQASGWEWKSLSCPPRWSLAVDEEGRLYAGDLGSIGKWRTGDRRPRRLWRLLDRRIEVVTDQAEPRRSLWCPRDRERNLCYSLEQQGPGAPVLLVKRPLTPGTKPSVVANADFQRLGPLVLAPDGALYATAGPRVQRIALPAGTLTTVGGVPLGGVPSRLINPRLLGLGTDRNHLLVADYDDRCVWLVSLDDGAIKARVPSRGSWSPAGVAVVESTYFLLEHRLPTFIGTVLGRMHAPARIRVYPPEGKVFTLAYLRAWTLPDRQFRPGNLLPLA